MGNRDQRFFRLSARQMRRIQPFVGKNSPRGIVFLTEVSPQAIGRTRVSAVLANRQANPGRVSIGTPLARVKMVTHGRDADWLRHAINQCGIRPRAPSAPVPRKSARYLPMRPQLGWRPPESTRYRPGGYSGDCLGRRGMSRGADQFGPFGHHGARGPHCGEERRISLGKRTEPPCRVISRTS